MYLNQQPVYRRRRAAAALLAAAAVFTGTIACSSATDTTPVAVDTRRAGDLVTTENTPSLKDREADMIYKLRGVNIIPDHATERDGRHEGFELSMDFNRTIDADDQAAVHAKVVQHADRLQVAYGITEEQAAYWVGAALRTYAPRYADTIAEG